MNHLFKFTFLSLVLLILHGCDREKEAIPSYLHIKKFTFTTDIPNEGLNTFEISSAKVFVNGQEVGTFELPVTIPVIMTGWSEITLLPNIRENGSANYHKVYKPYVGFIDTIELQQLRVDTIQPKTKYRPNTTFSWIEDFDTHATPYLERFGLNNTNDSLLVINTSNAGVDQPFSGSKKCGLIDIAPRDSAVDFERATYDAFTNGWYYLPNLGTDVYIEMDYKSNVNIQVGVFTDDGIIIQRVPVLFTYATDKWKKIYINLKSEIGDLPSTTRIKVFFGVYKDAGDIVTHPLTYLDNLKLVYVN